jgi:hypothetical protein
MWWCGGVVVWWCGTVVWNGVVWWCGMVVVWYGDGVVWWWCGTVVWNGVVWWWCGMVVVWYGGVVGGGSVVLCWSPFITPFAIARLCQVITRLRFFFKATKIMIGFFK